MLINPFTGVVNSALSGASLSGGVNKIQKAITQLATGRRITEASDDVSALSIAKSLQNEITGLRSALSNTGQLTSLLQVADEGTQQIQSLLGEAQSLATQSKSGTLNDDNRAALDQAFQSVLAQITSVSQNTKFSDTPLLDGSLSGNNSLSLGSVLGEDSKDSTLSIESLDAANLLGSGLDIKTKEGADQALSAIQQAFNIVGTSQASIGAFSEQLDFASAYIETAINNQDAARSSLEDADFAQASTDLSLAKLRQDASTLIKVQVKHLPPSMVEQLVG